MRILLTGAHGFIGTALLKLKTGHDIIPANRGWIDHPNDVLWHNFDAVIHLAAAGVQGSDREWDECMRVNFHAVRAMLDSISKSKAQPLVYLASSALCRDMSGDIKKWANPYVVSKYLGGRLAYSWGRSYSGVLIVDELENCYQPGKVEETANGIIALIEAREHS